MYLKNFMTPEMQSGIFFYRLACLWSGDPRAQVICYRGLRH